MRRSLSLIHIYNTIFAYSHGVTRADRLQEFVAQTVHGRHGMLAPNTRQNGAGGGQAVDGFGEQKTGGLPAHAGRCEQNHATGGGTNGLRFV